MLAHFQLDSKEHISIKFYGFIQENALQRDVYNMAAPCMSNFVSPIEIDLYKKNHWTLKKIISCPLITQTTLLRTASYILAETVTIMMPWIL